MNMKKEFKTCTLEFMKKNTDVTVENNSKFQKIAQYETGAMFVSPNGKYAVAIIDGKVKVGERPTAEDRKTQDYPDGWKWTGVFGQGKVTVNEVFTGILYTNLCTVMSQNGKLEIKDNLITMLDGNGTTRFRAGLTTVGEGEDKKEQYVFELYDPNAQRNMYIDDNGNLTMCGVFKTGEDGEARTVIDGNGIQSYDKQNKKSGLWIDPKYSELILYYKGDEYFKIYNSLEGPSVMANGNSILNASSSRTIGQGNWGFENGADGVFTTPNNKRVTVSGGLITDISDITVGE